MKKIITAAAIIFATTSAQAFWGDDSNSSGYGNYDSNAYGNGYGNYRGDARGL